MQWRGRRPADRSEIPTVISTGPAPRPIPIGADRAPRPFGGEGAYLPLTTVALLSGAMRSADDA